jgi:hypothetical protein
VWPDGLTVKDMSLMGRRFVFMIALLLPGSSAALAQISPGALSRAHSSLDSAKHCIDCHEIGTQQPHRKCLACHREIGRQLETRRGLHPGLVGSEPNGKACSVCHLEHNGRDFELIQWDPPQQNLDHRRTGYTLAGRHAALTCRQCHQPSHISSTDDESMMPKDRSRTFLGLTRDCLGCHADPHRAQLSAQCETCHDTVRWQNAVQYDHAKARFALSGPHEKVECRKCHPEVTAASGKPFIKFRDLAFSDCTPCHDDPHHGAFQASCKTCHTLPSWKPAATSTVFDHTRSRFPLAGKHAGLPCKSCHVKSDFKQPVAHNLCGDCHRQSPHKNQFAGRADRGECSSCHKVDGFKPATFDVARHRTTGFPLEGKHIGLRCDQCHTPWTAAVVYKISDTRCAKCHADKHAGQFGQSPSTGQCEACHTVRGFAPSTFTLSKHQTTRFALAGAHGAVVCVECHAAGAGKPAVARYRFDNMNCSGCHEDIHKGQFAARMSQQGAGGVAQDCTACHSNRAWKELPGFDHNGTKFPLAGSHRLASCDRCHRRQDPKPEWRSVLFQSAPHQCASCHEDEHGGQFNVAGSTNCSRCHSEGKWKPSLFDHNRGSDFTLTGAHRNTTCAACHMARMAGDRKMTLYKGVPRVCSGCHATKAPGNNWLQ